MSTHHQLPNLVRFLHLIEFSVLQFNWFSLDCDMRVFDCCTNERSPEAIQLLKSDLPENIRFLSKISPVNILSPRRSQNSQHETLRLMLNIYITPIILRSLHNITFIRFMSNSFLRRCCKGSFELKANAKNNKFYRLLSCFRSSEIQIS